MSYITSKFYPITDIFFTENTKVDLTQGGPLISAQEPHIIGIHVFNWSPESWLIIETTGGQIIRFPSTSLVEGAIYYMRIKTLIEAGPNKEETQVMGLSTSS